MIVTRIIVIAPTIRRYLRKTTTEGTSFEAIVCSFTLASMSRKKRGILYSVAHLLDGPSLSSLRASRRRCCDSEVGFKGRSM